MKDLFMDQKGEASRHPREEGLLAVIDWMTLLKERESDRGRELLWENIDDEESLLISPPSGTSLKVKALGRCNPWRIKDLKLLIDDTSLGLWEHGERLCPSPEAKCVKNEERHEGDRQHRHPLRLRAMSVKDQRRTGQRHGLGEKLSRAVGI